MSQHAHGVDLDAHKQKLIAQGELFRVGIIHSRANVGHALRPEALLQGVVDNALGFASHRVEGLMAPGGFRLQMVMPYIWPVLTYFGRNKKMVKPAIGIVAVAAGAVGWWLRRKR